MSDEPQSPQHPRRRRADHDPPETLDREALLARVADLEATAAEVRRVGAEHGALHLTLTNVDAAVDALKAALDLSVQDRGILHGQIEELGRKYAEMNAALADVQTALTANSVDQAEMRTSMNLVIAAWDAQRKQEEKAEKERRARAEAERLQREEQAERLEFIIRWGLGAVAGLGMATLLVVIGTSIERSGGLSHNALTALIVTGVLFLIGAGLWVKYGFGLRPGTPHPPHLAHPPHHLPPGGPRP